MILQLLHTIGQPTLAVAQNNNGVFFFHSANPHNLMAHQNSFLFLLLACSISQNFKIARSVHTLDKLIIHQKQINQVLSMKGLKKFLNKYGFVGQTLATVPLQSFDYLFQILADEIESKDSLLFDAALSREQKISKILEAVGGGYESITLYLVMKKIGVLFMMSRKYIEKGRLDDSLRTFLQENISRIIGEDVTSLLESRENKTGSLTKIYRYIRELSGSKQNDEHGLTKIEHNSQKGLKGALRETLNKALVPFCAYLLKILQEYQTYRQIFKCQVGHSNEIRWKLINWSLSLGEITNRICRLSRYFTKDFSGVLVFIVFLCSKDLARYYDLIKTSIEQQSMRVSQRIAPVNLLHGSKSVTTEELRNLRESIMEMGVIKEKLNGIYGNKILDNYIQFFSKPAKYRVFNEQVVKEVELIMEHTQVRNRLGEKEAGTCVGKVERKKTRDCSAEQYVSWSEESCCLSTQSVIELRLQNKRSSESPQRRLQRGERKRIQLVE